ncbi:MULTISPECIES: multicopper oxidase domain-containing protein [Bacillaceae]|uniref:multicopper oxidase domain-containing protein n=1 Tax=Bacillaceae TaxID=186817 RepID=UPI00195A3EBA|nr:multicopper oxidase domain-containing protein [Oceanobacillus caeni]MBU8791355.1 multicopper oxidase domain-containing protein [Oceanobacillus caeni]
MKKSILTGAGLLLILTGCTNITTEQQSVEQTMESGEMQHEENMDMNHGDMEGMEEHMDHDNIPPLQASKGTQELVIPPLLEKQKESDFDYEVVAQEGTTQFFDGSPTNTYGYNGNLLGPTLQLKEGETVKVKVRNELNEPTTFHWHGLEVPGTEDGGPSDVIQPGESKIVTLKADQPAATLWYHPHPHKSTAEQVFKGLAGMLYVEETDEEAPALPHTYGVDDIPLIFQDRLFDENKQLDYKNLMNSDGTIGDVSLVNGTINPKLTVTKPLMRFRILNGANARNYTFRLSNGATFTQIASDGGLLHEPVEMDEITLSPSERAEILIDFSAMESDEPIAITDEEGNALLPFDLDIDGGTEEMESISWTDDTTFLKEEEKSLPVSKKIELFGMMDKVTINGKKFDPERIDLRQKKGVSEVWEVYNKPDEMGGMIHPFHIHGTQFKIISRDGREPAPNEQGLKDSVLIEPGERVRLLVTFPEEGIYMYHCHILEHEDNGMMGQVEVY